MLQVIIFIIIKLLTGTSAPAKQAASLASYANTATEVRLTISNPVQAPVNHREIQITVGRDIAHFTLYKVYDQDIVRTKTYATGEEAYRNFLRSLELSGQYTKGNDDPAKKDEHGYCALGERYVYEIIDAEGTVKQHYWSTSCGPKTFGGNIAAVQDLFIAQIPDYDELTRDVEL